MSNEQTMFKSTDEVANQPEQNSQTESNSENDPLFDTLVGEGKKFSNKESLAKGKVEADKHVDHLEEQIKELREELSKRDTAKEIAEQLRNERQLESTPAPGNTPPNLTEEEVAGIVRNTMTDLESSRTIRENVLEAQKLFHAMHGDKTDEVLGAKAVELGMTKEQLGDIAGKSPTAFAKMVGLDQKSEVSHDQSPMEGDQNIEALAIHNDSNTLKEGSKAYWNAERKRLGEKYWTPAIQQRVLKDKTEGRYDA